MNPRSIFRSIRSVVALIGLDVRRYRPQHVYVPSYLIPSAHKLIDFRQDPAFNRVAGKIRSERRTTLGMNRLLTLWQAVRNTATLDGIVVEIGSYRGGSAKFLAESFRSFNAQVNIHIFDTFAGHAEIAIVGVDAGHAQSDFSDTSATAVGEYLKEFGEITLHQGYFEDNQDHIANERIRLMHLDVDIYRSAGNALRFAWPRLVENGIIVVDDYGFTSCPGLKQAVDEFLEEVNDAQGWYIHTGQFVITKNRRPNGD